MRAGADAAFFKKKPLSVSDSPHKLSHHNHGRQTAPPSSGLDTVKERGGGGRHHSQKWQERHGINHERAAKQTQCKLCKQKAAAK